MEKRFPVFVPGEDFPKFVLIEPGAVITGQIIEEGWGAMASVTFEPEALLHLERQPWKTLDALDRICGPGLSVNNAVVPVFCLVEVGYYEPRSRCLTIIKEQELRDWVQQRAA